MNNLNSELFTNDCWVCNDRNHIPMYCPLMHYVANKWKIIYDYNAFG